MKTYWDVEVFLTSAVDGGEWSASRPYRFKPGKSHRNPLDRRLGGPRAGLDTAVAKRKSPVIAPAGN